MTRVILVTGLSGSGKTLAAKSLEDMGFFAVDNLPIALIEPFVELLERGDQENPRAVLVVDSRERAHLEQLPELIRKWAARDNLTFQVMFFSASDETLARRFAASRRPHPLVSDEVPGLRDAITAERRLMHPLHELAHEVINTDELSPHDLRRLIKSRIEQEPTVSSLAVNVVSFGFKYGGLRESELQFDVRFLPNPYFIPDLKPLSGLDPPVAKFLSEQEDYQTLLRHLEKLLSFVMPRFVHEGKSYLTIGVGCTGGRHRSVAIAQHLREFLADSGFAARVTHRDLGRDVERGAS